MCKRYEILKARKLIVEGTYGNRNSFSLSISTDAQFIREVSRSSNGVNGIADAHKLVASQGESQCAMDETGMKLMHNAFLQPSSHFTIFTFKNHSNSTFSFYSPNTNNEQYRSQ